jgi:site-specific DNA-methyltransferase (adenine-specific)
MNPPYSKGIKDFLRKAHDEALKGSTCVALIPANTETYYFQNYCLDRKAVDSIVFIDGRLKFTIDRVSQGSPRFASVLVFFDSSYDWKPIDWFKSDRTFSKVTEI